MSAKEFRAELLKIMPGYKWTIHKTISENEIEATGTMSSGSNRLSTLFIVRSERDGEVTYEAKSAGYGRSACWLSSYADGTLARALRGLQQAYTATAATHKSHADALEKGRKAEGKS